MDEIFQLVFFLLIAVGWVIKTIADQKKRKAEGPPAPKPTDLEVPEPQPQTESRHRPTPTPTPRSAPRASRPPRPPALPKTTPVRRPLADRTEVAPLESRVAARHLRPHTPEAEYTRGAGSVRTQERRRSMLRRLTGGVDLAPGRKLTRAGVLWSEILGPPRAVTGPHRSPVVKRQEARR